MASKYSRIRTSLRLASDGLQSLTDGDLSECKWPIKRRILVELFSICPSLRDQNEELTELLEKREEEICKLRHETITREEKVEREQRFRTSLMKIVVSGLTLLRWPPSIEAFSDPIGSLFSDPEYFFSAISFILDIAVPQDSRQLVVEYSNPSAEIDHGSFSPRVPLLNDQSANDSTLRTSRRQTPSNKTTDRLLSLDTSLIDVRVSRGISNSDDVMSVFSDESSITSRSMKGNEKPRGGSLTAQKSLTSPEIHKSLEILQSQNEMLSKQLKHAQISICAREAAEARMATVMSELCQAIDEIVNICDPSGSGATGAPYDTGSATTMGGGARGKAQYVDPSNITDSEEKEFKRLVAKELADKEEIRREAANFAAASRAKVVPRSLKEFNETQKLKTKFSGNDVDEHESCERSSSSAKKDVPPLPPRSTQRSSGVGNSAPPSGGSSAIVWSRLRERIGTMQAQWDGAVREARKSVFDAVNVPPETAAFLSSRYNQVPGAEYTYSKSSGQRTGRDIHSQKSTARSTNGSSMLRGGNSSSSSSGGGGSSSSTRGGGGGGVGTSGSLTQRSTFSATSSSPNSSPAKRLGGTGATNVSMSMSRPTRLLMHQILGVRPPIGMAPSPSGGGGGGEVGWDLSSGASAESPLDLARIHLLQRDLVSFAEAAFAISDFERPSAPVAPSMLASALDIAASGSARIEAAVVDGVSTSDRINSRGGSGGSSGSSSHGRRDGGNDAMSARAAGNTSTTSGRPRSASAAKSSASRLGGAKGGGNNAIDKIEQGIQGLAVEGPPRVPPAAGEAPPPPRVPTKPPTGAQSCAAVAHESAAAVARPDALPLSVAAAERVARQQELGWRAQELLLHLAALAPIAPLSVDSPLGSHLSGLEALLEEVSKSLGGGGQSGRASLRAQKLRLQAAGDRAQAEQVAVIRCLQKLRSQVRQWAQCGQRAAPLLEKFGARAAAGVRAAVGEVGELAAGVRRIRNALRAAEESRLGDGVGIEQTGGGGGGGSAGGGYRNGAAAAVRVSPLDSLCRGVMGAAVSELVTTLRMHSEELAELEARLEAVAARLQSGVAEELGTLDRMKQAVLTASEASLKYIQEQDAVGDGIPPDQSV